MTLYEFKDYKEFEEAALHAKERNLLIETFTPVPCEELAKKLNVDAKLVSYASVAGGLFGFILAMSLTLVPNLMTFPLNVGGRPLNSWPPFLVIGFELTVLFSAFSAVAMFFFLNRFPRYDKAVFSIPQFNKKKDEHFFILVKKEVPDVASVFATYSVSPDA